MVPNQATKSLSENNDMQVISDTRLHLRNSTNKKIKTEAVGWIQGAAFTFEHLILTELRLTKTFGDLSLLPSHTELEN